MNPHLLLLRRLGRQDYAAVYRAMQDFTTTRTAASVDELWQLEHPSVFTQGMAGKAQHLLAPGDIPVIHTDRGGQVTYHGPGQVVIYCLLDVRRLGLTVRALVTALEQAVVALLASHGVNGATRRDAPGVYVDAAKIASLGLRIRQGRSYHGLSLNVDMDLEPFSRINPCGYAGLRVTQLRDLGVTLTLQATADALLQHLAQQLGATALEEAAPQIMLNAAPALQSQSALHAHSNLP